MAFTPEVNQRILALGGTVGTSEGSLEERLLEIDFSNAAKGADLLSADWADYADDEIFDALAADSTPARDLVGYPQFNWSVRRFTPFTPGTADHDEWADIIDTEILTELSGMENPVVLLLGYNEGFPNYYFVLTDDSNPSNPTVYSTDHESYFTEVEEEETLLALLESFLTVEEFAESVTAVLEEIRAAE